MDRVQADVAIADLGRYLGIVDFALDAEGTGVLSLDEFGQAIGFGFNTTSGSIDLMICLAEVEPSPARARMALRANFGWPAPGCQTIARDPTSGAYVLQRRYFGQDLGERGLAGAIEELVEQAAHWTKRLTSARQRQEVLAEPADDGSEAGFAGGRA